MGKFIEITEVCPRDGWQNHAVIIPTETKLKYMHKMIEYGARSMDATSFVNPKVMPQMADAADVVNGITPFAEEKGCKIFGLTLNGKGVDRAVALGMKNLEFVISASQEHNMRNSRCPIEDSVEAMKHLTENAQGLNISLGMACVFGSPFGDEIDLDRVVAICEAAKSVGIHTFGMADTAGISDPVHTAKVLDYLAARMDLKDIVVHLHDTRGMGIANAYVALEHGITRFEAALAGLGGCPFAKGAKGNIASEDLVNMCHQMGYETGYDLELMTATAKEMCEEIGAQISSSMALACHA